MIKQLLIILVSMLDRKETLSIFSSWNSAVKKYISVIEFRKKSSSLTLLRPGAQEGVWQCWELPLKKEDSSQVQDQPILKESAVPPPLQVSQKHWLIAVPTRDLMIIPLWVASHGNLEELVILELSSKHLLRRGMKEGLKIVVIEVLQERTLVVVYAPVAIPSLATASYLKEAQYFEAAARLLPAEKIDLLLWYELGEICFALIKNNQLLWFSGSGEVKITPFLLGLIKRMALHLQAESIIEHMPQNIGTIGPFSAEERTLLQQNLGITQESCKSFEELPSPLIPNSLLDLPSEQARHERFLQTKKDKIKKIARFAIMSYFFFLVSGVMNLLLKESIAVHLSHQLTKTSAPIEKAKRDLAQWQELRFAIDPTTYTLDLLAAVANQIHGEKIRLISFAGMGGRLQITGEATDVSEVYHFLESIKKSPQLQEYQWTSSQPKLAGKNNVRFETEGSLPHAKTNFE